MQRNLQFSSKYIQWSYQSLWLKIRSIASSRRQPEPVKQKENIQFEKLDIDKSRPWGFFDGSRGPKNFCSAGAVLYLSEDHCFKLRAGLGEGSSNYAEFMALKILLDCARNKNVNGIQVFGDSLLAIDYMKESCKVDNKELESIGTELKEMASSFDNRFFTHIYRKKNKEADILSKEAQRVPEGTLISEEIKRQYLDLETRFRISER